MSAVADRLWPNVAALIDAAGSIDALRSHRLALVAASIWQADGRPVPAELDPDRRRLAANALAAPVLLHRARAAYGGRLMLMKGAEAAAAYPDPSGRSFCDLDLLADDPFLAQRALLAAGFIEPMPYDWELGHHLPALHWPGMPLRIEIHRTLRVPPWLPAPPVADLLGAGVPSRTGVQGLLAPEPEAHALLLAAHAWAHRPLGRLGDLLDVALVMRRGDRQRAAALAGQWGWGGMWRITTQSIDALLLGRGRPPAPLTLFGRHLAGVRDQSVFEYHMLGLLAPLAAVPRRRLPGVLADLLMQLGRRRHGECWRDRLAHAGAALRDVRLPKAVHDVSMDNQPWAR